MVNAVSHFLVFVLEFILMYQDVKKPSNMGMILWRNADGSLSYGKIGIIAAAVAYTVLWNPWFLLGMFEIFIILYFIYAAWRIVTSMMKSEATVAA